MHGHENLCNSLLTVKLAGYVIYIYTVPPANKVLWGIPVEESHGPSVQLSIHLFYSSNLIWTIFVVFNGELFEILTSCGDCYSPQCDLNLWSFGQGH